MAPIIFYDLTVNNVEPGAGPLFSPNTWITRMLLLQMQLDFRVVELDLQALRSPYFMDVLGDRPLVPLIEFPNEGGADTISESDKVGALLGGPEWVQQRGKPHGQLVMDSQGIAFFLAEKFPAQPSPYLPDVATPLTPQDQRALRVAQAFAQLVKFGLGTSDARWGWHFELSAPAIAQRYSGEDRAFYEGDIKNGKGGWAKIMAMDRVKLLANTRWSLMPIEELLSTQSSDGPTLFLQSPSAPGFADFALFGRYAMARSVDAALAEAIWSEDDSKAKAWLTNAEGWDGEVKLANVQRWVERMLDLYNGHARKSLSR